MTVDALRARLLRDGIMVQLDGDRLHVIAPVGKLTPALSDELRTHKAALVALLKRQRTGPPFLPTSVCGSRTLCEASACCILPGQCRHDAWLARRGSECSDSSI
jgi:hypothetical protein